MRHFPLVDLFTMLSWRNAGREDETEKHRYKSDNAIEHSSLDSFNRAISGR